MTSSVLLLRGINVGGRGKLPMAKLRTAIEAAGGIDPKTYIQTGNAVFRERVTEVALSDEIEARAGIRPQVMPLGARAFAAIRQDNPFSGRDGRRDGAPRRVPRGTSRLHPNRPRCGEGFGGACSPHLRSLFREHRKVWGSQATMLVSEFAFMPGYHCSNLPRRVPSSVRERV